MNLSPKKSRVLPFRSEAGALLLCVVLGPVGLLYATLLGGVVLMVLSLFIVKARLLLLLVPVWLVSCVWGVLAARLYNRRILRQ